MTRLRNWQLFAICVGVWGTTWHAITYQIAGLAPEFGVALRFALAGCGLLAFAARRGERLRFDGATQRLLALQGVFLYGVSYVCVYHAEAYVASGLVAVGYSASPLITGLGASALFGVAIGGRFVIGGLLGLVGVALIFWPEIARPSEGDRGAWGAVFTTASVLLSAVGSLAASRVRRRGVGLLPGMGFGMLYAALAAALLGVIEGRAFAWPTAPSWWLSLAWLAFAGSALAFACFLTLQDRLGPGPAGTVGVMTPLLALLISLLFEGFRADVLTVLGGALAFLGNAMMLLPGRRVSSTGGAPAVE